MIAASSASVRVVERDSFGPVLRSSNVILDLEPVEEALLRVQPLHHRPILPATRQVNQLLGASARAEFSTSIDQYIVLDFFSRVYFVLLNIAIEALHHEHV